MATQCILTIPAPAQHAAPLLSDMEYTCTQPPETDQMVGGHTEWHPSRMCPLGHRMCTPGLDSFGYLLFYTFQYREIRANVNYALGVPNIDGQKVDAS